MTNELNANVLSTQLKALCKATMSDPDSECCDGSCEDCPITLCLEMAEQAADK